MNKLFLLVFVVAAFTVGLLIAPTGIQLITGLLPASVELISVNPADTFLATMNIAIAFALPFVIYPIASYLSPALYKKEKKALKKLLPATIGLFLVGALFGTILITSFGLPYFAGVSTQSGITNLWNVREIIGLISYSIIAFGLAFQLPIALIGLQKAGIIETKQLTSQRGKVFLACFIIGAIMTPPDLFTQIIMAFPLYALFEATIFYLSISKKKEVFAKCLD
jgi:sec-independent protein translocase protein TatC